jgi:hypothetical protein
VLCTKVQAAESNSLGNTVPTSLDACIQRLRTVLPKEFLNNFSTTPRSQLWKFNSTVGVEIRNNWLYGHGQEPLARYFNKLGVKHPDHISALILQALWKNLRSEPFDIDKESKSVRSYEIQAQDVVKETISIPEELRSIMFTSTKGQRTNLLKQLGHVTVLGFVTADGPYDPYNLQYLNSVQKKYSKFGVKVICFLMPDPKNPPKPYSKYKFQFPFIEQAPKDFVERLTKHISSPASMCLPCNVLLDRNGLIVFKVGCFHGKYASLLNERLDILLGDVKRPKGSD